MDKDYECRVYKLKNASAAAVAAWLRDHGMYAWATKSTLDIYDRYILIDIPVKSDESE